ncbi:DUF7424 family protein [Pacificispira sp.]|uniref:DUF7424 family protein n=1 Tax=Pacificispira sp. TaxID=2888761 RepID=UPI003BA96436
MFRFLISLIGSIVVAAGLAGCKDEVAFHVYSRDMQDVIADPEARGKVQAEYASEVLMGVEKCTAQVEKLLPTLGQMLDLDADRPGWCEKNGISTFLRVRFWVQIVNPTVADVSYQGVGVLLSTRASDGSSQFNLYFPDEGQQALKDAVASVVPTARFDPRDVSYRIVLHNDLRQPIELRTVASYVDGEIDWPDGAQGFYNVKDVDTRASAHVRLSDWVRDLTLLSPGQFATFYWIEKD